MKQSISFWQPHTQKLTEKRGRGYTKATKMTSASRWNIRSYTRVADNGHVCMLYVAALNEHCPRQAMYKLKVCMQWTFCVKERGKRGKLGGGSG